MIYVPLGESFSKTGVTNKQNLKSALYLLQISHLKVHLMIEPKNDKIREWNL